MDASSSHDGGGAGDDDEPYLLGFIVSKIVGMRHYFARVDGHGSVGLVREPLNTYDENAIAVYNTRDEKVGHLPAPVAKVLAPLLDSGILAGVHGLVPDWSSRPKINRSDFKPHILPCQVHLFAHPDAAAVIEVALYEAELELIHPNHPEFALSQAAAVKEQTKKADRDVDKLFSLVGGKEGKAQIQPVEAPEDVVLSELFDHQKEALGWMVHREESEDLPPFWEGSEEGIFENVLINQKTEERPPPLKGGIFADDMGLGKTLTLLSLIGRTKARNVGVKTAEGAKRRKVEDAGEGPRPTLVVCPPSVISSWVTQLEEHLDPGSLKVYLYHGERTRDPKELLKHDLVLTTYSILGTEFEQEDSPVKHIEWFRVILDEAHVIKNSAARQTKAVIALNAERRWVVTGTPIQNSSFDLYPLMAFLKFQPFSMKSYWQKLIQRPLERGNKTGLSRLQNILGAISLRRIKETDIETKSMVELPPKTVLECYIDLSEEEREIYDQMELEGKKKMQEFGDRDSILRNYSTVLYIILRLRQLCDDVSLCPLDVKSWLPSNSLEDVSKTPELLKKLASLVDDGDDFDCPICLSPPTKTVITSCTHIYCQTCILKILKSSSSRCPICRRSLSKEDLFLAPEVKHSDEDGSGNTESDRPLSSKVQTLLKLLKTSQNEDPSSKSVVFSQFKKMLILLEAPLKNAGFNILRLDGSMSLRKRLQVIKQFAHGGPDSPTVLLASLKAAGAGVNLTAASTVYLFDPWWNPGVEEQAMDRVHRIGQKKEVRVVRLIVKDSIEERILSLQEKKKRLISSAFGKKGGKDDKEVRVEELRMMLGVDKGKAGCRW
ncbi:unnamed protein product [Urochloa decumbens]|uniref:Uncharacterized protein n=1 Tax=Urochloa decumbens TaxID=240449 RepID=A0ABC9EPV6_9POAL